MYHSLRHIQYACYPNDHCIDIERSNLFRQESQHNGRINIRCTWKKIRNALFEFRRYACIGINMIVSRFYFVFGCFDLLAKYMPSLWNLSTWYKKNYWNNWLTNNIYQASIMFVHSNNNRIMWTVKRTNRQHSNSRGSVSKFSHCAKNSCGIRYNTA